MRIRRGRKLEHCASASILADIKGRTFAMDFFVVVLISVIVRYMVGLHPHSGESSPPMYGDYEAQRHWQEITVSLPMNEWYTNSSNNDLQYWGLDYPPFSAWHSYAVGKVMEALEPASVALFESRGYQTYNHRIFMRLSVIAIDLLLYLPAVYLFLRLLDRTNLSNLQRKTDSKSLYSWIMYALPALILVDHGHFQYNNMTLGLFLLSIVSLFGWNSPALCAVFFSLALNYKQMALYYSPIVFFALWRYSFHTVDVECEYESGDSKAVIRHNRKSTLSKVVTFLSVAMSTLSVFAVFWVPFYARGGWDAVVDVWSRQFPLDRGLFEDKVANFWCMMSPFTKRISLLHGDNGRLFTLSAALTMAAAMPAIYAVVRMPFVWIRSAKLRSRYLHPLCREVILLGFSLSSLSFFLFSYQVHEKTVLFPLFALSLCRNSFADESLVVINLVAIFSLHPLMVKDELVLVYWCSIVILVTLSSLECEYGLLTKLTLLVIMGFHYAEMHYTPPSKYPDLFPYVNSVLCTLFLFGLWETVRRKQLKCMGEIEAVLRQSGRMKRE